MRKQLRATCPKIYPNHDVAESVTLVHRPLTASDWWRPSRTSINKLPNEPQSLFLASPQDMNRKKTKHQYGPYYNFHVESQVRLKMALITIEHIHCSANEGLNVAAEAQLRAVKGSDAKSSHPGCVATRQVAEREEHLNSAEVRV